MAPPIIGGVSVTPEAPGHMIVSVAVSVKGKITGGQLTIEFCGIYMFEIPIIWNRENFYDQLGHPDIRRFITFYGFLEE